MKSITSVIGLNWKCNISLSIVFYYTVIDFVFMAPVIIMQFFKIIKFSVTISLKRLNILLKIHMKANEFPS